MLFGVCWPNCICRLFSSNLEVFFFLPHWVACRILALQLKTEPRPSAVKVQSPNHCEFPLSLFLQTFFMPTIVSPLLLGLPLCICRYAWECTMDFWGSVYFFFFTFFSLTFLCFSHWIIFIDWSSCLPILSSTTEICCEAPLVNSFFSSSLCWYPAFHETSLSYFPSVFQRWFLLVPWLYL